MVGVVRRGLASPLLADPESMAARNTAEVSFTHKQETKGVLEN